MTNISRPWLLALFVVAVLGVGTVIGVISLPDFWYAALLKPSFNPPVWVFPPVWTFLYVLIAIAGYRTWLREPRDRRITTWFIQMALNLAWPVVFFRFHSLGGALAVIALLLVVVVAFTVQSGARDKIAAALFLPYVAWVAFATVLNAALLLLN